jgi:hypothetical protein
LRTRITAISTFIFHHFELAQSGENEAEKVNETSRIEATEEAKKKKSSANWEEAEYQGGAHSVIKE